MDQETKLLARQAIYENVVDSTARDIIWYVLSCEVWGQDTISPTNQYLMKKYNWSLGTTKVALSLAKKSQFITTTGRGRSRCLELNVGHLKGKMAELRMRKPIKNNLLRDIGKELGITEPNLLPNLLPNDLPNFPEKKNGSIKPQNIKIGGTPNPIPNPNISDSLDENREVYHNQEEEYGDKLDAYGMPIPAAQPKPPKISAVEPVFALWGKYPANWKINKTQRAAAENLLNERGLDKIKSALKFYGENKDDVYCPEISSPYDLDSKWKKLLSFKKKNNLWM